MSRQRPHAAATLFRGPMYAVIETGGKQYRVEVGTELEVELLDVEPGQSITLERVLLVADGAEAAVGTPVVDGAAVEAEVLGAIAATRSSPSSTARRRADGSRRATARSCTVLRIADIRFGGKSAAEAEGKAQGPRRRPSAEAPRGGRRPPGRRGRSPRREARRSAPRRPRPPTKTARRRPPRPRPRRRPPSRPAKKADTKSTRRRRRPPRRRRQPARRPTKADHGEGRRRRRPRPRRRRRPPRPRRRPTRPPPMRRPSASRTKKDE